MKYGISINLNSLCVFYQLRKRKNQYEDFNQIIATKRPGNYIETSFYLNGHEKSLTLSALLVLLLTHMHTRHDTG